MDDDPDASMHADAEGQRLAWSEIAQGRWRATCPRGIVCEVERHQLRDQARYWPSANQQGRLYICDWQPSLDRAQLAAEREAAGLADLPKPRQASPCILGPLFGAVELDAAPPAEPASDPPAAEDVDPWLAHIQRQPPLVREICKRDQEGAPRISCPHCSGSIQHPGPDGLRTVCSGSGLHTAWMHGELLAIGCLYRGTTYQKPIIQLRGDDLMNTEDRVRAFNSLVAAHERAGFFPSHLRVEFPASWGAVYDLVEQINSGTAWRVVEHGQGWLVVKRG